MLVELVASLPVVLIFVLAISSVFYLSASLTETADDSLQLEFAREDIISQFDAAASPDLLSLRAGGCVVDSIKKTGDRYEIRISKNGFHKRMETTVILPAE
ncbi:MAG: hypothetical protein Q4F74_05510 [Synergistaceae bacterium]|nr:hypothetical protein [Synergistaceae bacterium]